MFPLTNDGELPAFYLSGFQCFDDLVPPDLKNCSIGRISVYLLTKRQLNTRMNERSGRPLTGMRYLLLSYGRFCILTG